MGYNKRMKMRIALYVLAGIILLGCVFLFIYYKTDSIQAGPILHLPNKDISLIIASTPAARTQGLSGKDTLPANTGMLFVFDKPDTYAFWMKDMKFSIDIIWLDSSYSIVHIESDVSPSTFPTTFTPPQKSLYVLEANAHFADENNLKIGDILQFDLIK